MVIIYHSTMVHAGTPSASADTGVIWAFLWLARYGNLGVPLFFVISGYCIAAAADRARRHDHAVRTYFVRRFRRIYPPLWAVIAASVLFFLVVDYVLWPGLLSNFPWQQPRPWWYSPWQWAGNLTLTETWRHYFVGGPRGHFPGQAWTLCYEEQFYAVTGLLLWLMPRRFFLGTTLVTIGCAAMLLFHAALSLPVEGFFFDGNWFMFAAGLAVYYVLTYAVERRLVAAVLLAVAGAIVCTMVELRLGSAMVFGGLLLALHPIDGRLKTWRPVAGLEWCGTMCYSLYLVHQIPVKAVSAALYASGFQSGYATLLVVTPASVALSLLLGRLFFLGVESRFLNRPIATLGTRQPRQPVGEPAEFAPDLTMTGTV
jgi:peptidoglycan/LPS O-acetylase OafA/YrhL